MKRFCSLLSGGKDSNYALYTALKSGMKPSCILVVTPARNDSWMFHTPYTSLAELQVESMGLREYLVRLTVSGRKEEEVDELEDALVSLWEERGFDTIVVGALASRYQYTRIKRIADRIGAQIFAPAWQADPEEYMRRLVGEGLKFILIRISVMGLPQSLLGRPIGPGEVEEIIRLSRKYGFHPAFEGGEAETLVYDAPHYSRKLCIEAERIREAPYTYTLNIKNVRLAGKDEGECIKVDGESYP